MTDGHSQKKGYAELLEQTDLSLPESSRRRRATSFQTGMVHFFTIPTQHVLAIQRGYTYNNPFQFLFPPHPNFLLFQ